MSGRRCGDFPRTDALDDLPVDGAPVFRLTVLRARQPHVHRDDLARAETRIDSAQARDAPDEEPRADEQRERDSHLGHDQPAPQSVAARTRARAPAAVLQRLVQIGARKLEGRRELFDARRGHGPRPRVVAPELALR